MIEKKNARRGLNKQLFNQWLQSSGAPEKDIKAMLERWTEDRLVIASARPTGREALHAEFVSWACSQKGLPDQALELLRKLPVCVTRNHFEQICDVSRIDNDSWDGEGPEPKIVAELRRAGGKVYYGRVGLKPGLPAPVSIAPVDGLAVLIASQRSIVASLAAALDEARTVLASLETAQADISPDEK